MPARQLPFSCIEERSDFSLSPSHCLGAIFQADDIGLTYLPELYCRDELKSGRFVAVLPDRTKPSATVQAVYLSPRELLPSIRALIDYLAKHLRAEPSNEAAVHPEPLTTELTMIDAVVAG
jgi:DNA-binding transcriptional LysR family regulator